VERQKGKALQVLRLRIRGE